MEELQISDMFYALHITEGDSRRNKTDITCPECGKKGERKLNVNFEKNVWFCNKCGIGGGAAAFWALMRGLDPHDLKSAAKDFYAFTGKEDYSHQERPVEVTVQKDEALASINERNNTYRNLLSLLSLNEEHRDDLLRRGFNELDIAKSDYRSYPQTGLEEIAYRLMLKGCAVKGVPGFYQKKSGKWALRKMGPGYLIPQKNSRGQIQGFQIRVDNPLDAKYLTLSTSGFNGGSQGRANLHFVQGRKGGHSFILTEGPLKGDLINKFTGFSVLAVQGVNAISSLPCAIDALVKKGYDYVFIAFDMDVKKKSAVKRALKKLEGVLSEKGLPYKNLYWDEEYKGLDDWLLARTQCQKEA